MWLLNQVGGLQVQVSGEENIPDGPCVIACKHQSAWETLVLGAILPPYVWVLKESLAKMPFFGAALRLVGAIGINRGKRQEAMRALVTEGKNRLAQGACVVVFPEATRYDPGTAGRYHAGAATLAIKGNVPLIPLAHNAGEFWTAKHYSIWPGVVQVRIGPPIICRGDSDQRETAAAIREWIEGAMTEITGTKFVDNL